MNMRRVFTINGKEQEYTVSATFMIEGREVEFTSCSAIAASIGDTVRQKAVFVHDVEDEFGDGDGVIFDVQVPKDAESAASILEEYLDTYQETLNTIKFERFKECRLAAGLTQQQLADRSGVNIRQIQRVEFGTSDAGNLTARNLLAIADALGVDPHSLIE